MRNQDFKTKTLLSVLKVTNSRGNGINKVEERLINVNFLLH
ncbi:hypothetical protein SAMN05421788_103274 [Filimonas lacunae]|uniref:Uncharacterized protein n=1 Tax=Filimonas lacunae TaxID=477680 RepID=A0A1N7P7V2_9BACT|nr:hypothetical protein SAMN05421788_103274 [Filimonas lacunae]